MSLVINSYQQNPWCFAMLFSLDRSVCRWCWSGGGGRSHGGLCRLEIHPHHFPDMAVRILEAAAVHEAVILLRRRIGLAASAAGLADHRVHRFAAVRRDADQHLARFP